MITNEKGMTLVNVLVAAGIIGGLGLVIMQISQNANSIQKKMDSDLEVAQLVNEIKLLLDDENSCTVSLQGLTFKKSKADDPSDLLEGIPLELYLPSSDGLLRGRKKISAIDPQLSKRKNIQINSLKLYMDGDQTGDYPESVSHKDYGTVWLTYSYQQGAKMHQNKKKSFLLKLKLSTDSSKITNIESCKMKPEPQNNEKEYIPTTVKYCLSKPWIAGTYYQPNFDCGMNQVIGGMTSTYLIDGIRPSRRFDVSCCAIHDSNGDVVEKKHCMESLYVHERARSFNYTCPANYIMAGMHKSTWGDVNDQMYSFTCCELERNARWSKVTNSNILATKDPMTGDYIYKQTFSYNCHPNGYVCGMYSEYDGANLDRVFRVKCCELEVEEKKE